MKKYIKYLLLASLTLFTASCHEDEIEDTSIFDTNPPQRNAFDQWLMNNYIAPYNIDYKYKWEDIETNMSYDLSPAGYNEAITLAKVVKYVWLEEYDEIAGIHFMRTYVPKQILVVGSAAYNADTQSTVLGTAEGGLKVILYNVNNISNYVNEVELLNKYYFHTMHHEFAHILHQAKNYDPDFKKITESDYIGSEWTEKTDTAANKLGFVTAYAMDQPDEDFVEIIACRVTNDQAWWDKMLEGAGKEGAEKITRKFEMVNNYLRNLWNIDIDRLRSVVLRRSKEVKDLDLNTL